MKPLIYLATFLLVLLAANAFACGEYRCRPGSCDHNPCRKHYVKVHYQYPVIYCDYFNDERGNPYQICHNCDRNKCVKEYIFNNYCNHDFD